MSNKKHTKRHQNRSRRKDTSFLANIEIIDTGLKGDGIGFHENEPVYVGRSIEGDIAQVRISRMKDGTLRGMIEHLTTLSSNRSTPPCNYYNECGGCTLQHLKPEPYKDWKNALLKHALERRGITPIEYKDPIFIEEGTRRRATLALFKQKGKLTIGYHKRRSKTITNITKCLVCDDKLLIIAKKLEKHIHRIIKDSRPIDLFIQLVDGAIDILITGPLETRTQEPDINTRLDIAEMAEKENLARVSWRLKDRNEPEVIIERTPVLKPCGSISVPLPPAAFLQPSREGENALIKATIDALPDKGPYADLFCGSGTFAGHIANHGHVDAYELESDAINCLDKASKSISQLKAIRRNLFENPITPKELDKYRAVIIDPPRAGAKEQTTHIANSKVEKVIYISCNPSTFARDAEILTKDGTYTLISAQTIDQFKWSHHVEVIGIFEKTLKKRS